MVFPPPSQGSPLADRGAEARALSFLKNYDFSTFFYRLRHRHQSAYHIEAPSFPPRVPNRLIPQRCSRRQPLLAHHLRKHLIRRPPPHFRASRIPNLEVVPLRAPKFKLNRSIGWIRYEQPETDAVSAHLGCYRNR